MKRLFPTLVSLLFFVQQTNAQCPPNIDFEQGTFANWQCFIGHVDTLNLANVITLTPSPPTQGRHEIIDSATAGLDPYGNFRTVSPYGGHYAVKLGNDDIRSEAEGMSYTFQIPPSADTFSMTYYYAVVFEDPGHDAIEQPRFFVSAYDVLTGAVIDCASYNYVSNGSIPGFLVSPGNSGVLYKEWSPASIDFSGLAGRQVRLEFKTADCTRGGHFGYAYVDVGTGCGGVLAVGAYCISTNSVTLNAPYGFQSYTWYNNNYTAVVGNTRTVIMSPPPPITSLFHVDMVPYPGYGCRDTADARVMVLPVPDTPVTASNIYYCQHDIVAPLGASASPGHELLWYSNATGGTASSTAPIPSTANMGNSYYWVSQKSLYGCEGPRKKITVTISPTPLVSFTINNNRQCQIGNSFVFTSTSTNTFAGSVCHWDFGDGQSSSQCAATHTYASDGQYNVTLTITNVINCNKQVSHTVYVIPKPTAAFAFPSLICENQTPIVLQDNSSVAGNVSTINGWWWLINGSVATIQSPPVFTANGGSLPIDLAVTTTEGCKSDTIHKFIKIHYSPLPAFSYGPLLCNNEIINIRDLSTLPAAAAPDRIIKWNWWYDNTPAASIQNPAIMFAAGVHHIKLVAETDQGCNWRNTDSVFTVHPKPLISLSISDSCVYRNIFYTAGVTTAEPVNKWLWNFGNGFNQYPSVITKKFIDEGYNPLTLLGETVHGCKDTLIRPFTIYHNRSRAERDTTVAMNEPLQLTVSNDANMLSYKWQPDIGLSNTTIKNPIAIYNDDIVYVLNTLTRQGCDSYSKIIVKRFIGPELYVPSAFSPNNDGLNDKLKVFPVGIKSFMYFSVYNRNGQLLFTTTDYFKGWDGTYKGGQPDPGNYVWFASAIDYRGHVLFRRGNVLLIR